ncbi:hypothetical protein ADK67_14370 [Saccharothrix sp. NRRL B-16348]|uniref:hypothetical protein n=1 Tax=Saccharothrix sp. NRRL B-16348 TaxID=1415542 RepID=UPI0006AD85C8|nr:hypothetical protein [Saccharothrix sp. NRRL B-16348]KOX27571.1 hypothetical protein ADK67_14370 [Saccharothrix sp. NRRL B-16348]
MTTDLDEVRRMLAPALEDDTGPRYSPEEVLRSARKVTTQRRAVVAGTVSMGVVLAIGAGVLVDVAGRSTVESASVGSASVGSASSPVLTIVPTDVPAVPTTPGHAAELTARLAAADVVPDGFEVLPTLSDWNAPPLRFTAFGSDTSGGYRASAVFSDAKGRVTLTLHVRSVTTPEKCTVESRCMRFTAVNGPFFDRPTVRTVDGVEVRVARDLGTGLPGNVSAEARFPDGTLVEVAVVNQTTVVDHGSLYNRSSTRDSVPFTERQLIEMIKKPGFSYQP